MNYKTLHPVTEASLNIVLVLGSNSFTTKLTAARGNPRCVHVFVLVTHFSPALPLLTPRFVGKVAALFHGQELLPYSRTLNLTLLGYLYPPAVGLCCLCGSFT